MIRPEKDISLAQYTSYKIGGIAREVYFPADSSEMLAVIKTLNMSETPYFLLGGGTNVLVGDGYWDGAVILTTRMNSFEAHSDRLNSGAGLFSSQAAEIALNNTKTGLELLYKLPGTIGGALAGNARFDDKNISDTLISLTAVHPDIGIRLFKADEIDFSYKYNRITVEGWYICELSLAWKDGDSTSIRQRMDQIEQFRKESHHFDFPSSGCIFKNDHEKNIQAGSLLDSLGLKGLTVGGAEVAGYHANFIVNNGSATACDILELIEKIESIVLEKTGITLEREVRLFGNF